MESRYAMQTHLASDSFSHCMGFCCIMHGSCCSNIRMQEKLTTRTNQRGNQLQPKLASLWAATATTQKIALIA